MQSQCTIPTRGGGKRHTTVIRLGLLSGSNVQRRTRVDDGVKDGDDEAMRIGPRPCGQAPFIHPIPAAIKFISATAVVLST